MALYDMFIIIIIFYPGTQFPGMKNTTLCYTEKYKNQAGMNLTPPPPSQNSHAVRWHCTAESKRRDAEIKIIIIIYVYLRSSVRSWQSQCGACVIVVIT